MTIRWRLALFALGPLTGCGTWAEPQADVWQITLTPPSALVYAGDSLKLGATMLDSMGQPVTGRAMTYRSDHPEVASVSPTGVVRGASRGTAYIEAISELVSSAIVVSVRLGGIVGPTGGTISIPGGGIALTVPSGALGTSTAIDLDSAALRPGESTPLAGTMFHIGPSSLGLSRPARLTIHYERGGLSIQDERSVGLYADSGLSWVAAPGSVVDLSTTSVTAPITGTGTYAILAPGPVASIAIDPKSVTVVYGTTLRLNCNLRDSLGKLLENRPIAWNSSDTTIVQVSQLGRVTPVSLGAVSVTASSGGMADTAIVISAFTCACFGPPATAPVSGGACTCAPPSAGSR